MSIVTQPDRAGYIQAGFNYEHLAPEVRTDVQESTRRIHELERRTSESIIEIGQQLIRVKQRLPHGEFLPWLDAEFGWSERTARNFMQVAEVFKSANFADVRRFQPSALYALASNNVPQEVRDDFAAVADAGHKVTHSDVQEAIREYKSGQTMNLRDFAAAEGVDLETGEILDDEELEEGAPATRHDASPLFSPTPPPAVPVKNVHVSNNSGENEWYTPPVYLAAARKVMGGFDLDPASSPKANETVQAPDYFTKDDNGLARNWFGRVWLNPPYAQPLISHFAEKVVEEYEEGRIDEAIVLVNNATETRWFQVMARVAEAICFPTGRIKYLDATGTPANTPLQGQAFLYFGPHRGRFVAVFEEFGVVR